MIEIHGPNRLRLLPENLVPDLHDILAVDGSLQDKHPVMFRETVLPIWARSAARTAAQTFLAASPARDLPARSNYPIRQSIGTSN